MHLGFAVALDEFHMSVSIIVPKMLKKYKNRLVVSPI